jgi:ABC-type lipoprotein export system ATPase subunit
VNLAVEANDLFRIYPSEEGASAALQGLTLEVREGELLVVFGPSGSGKSTLLRILAGLDRPSAGSVRVFGDDLRKLRGRALLDYRSRTLGYADQHYTRALAPELTAAQQISFRLGLLGLSARDRERTAAALLERVGLGDRGDSLPGELSGGQQQRVALAVALAHRPRLFVADEPTGELDAANAAQMYALIRDLSQASGVTTILVSHDPESAAVADRVVQIRDGRVSAETSGGESRAVVNRGGWIRVPEEFLRRAALGERARIEVDERGVLVSGDGSVAPAVPEEVAAPLPAADGPVVAETRGLARAYGTRAVLRDLSVSFNAGGLTAITGPSGSGKSTLLHLLAGLDLPDDGEVAILGEPISRLDATARAALRRSHVALVTQGTDLVPFLGAQETVELALAMRGVDGDEATQRATSALADVGLSELAAQRVARLSMGERQRVALARALAARPALLLADEPTARLDEANARATGALFADLAARTGTAIVCATHDPVLIEHAHAEVSLGGSVAA